MSEYISLRACQVRHGGAIFRVDAGAILTADSCPNHHFVPLPAEGSKSLWDILAGKLKEANVEVDDVWDVDHMQKLLAEKKVEESEPEEEEKIKEALKEIDVKYHHKVGLKKLRLLARENHIEV